MGKIRLRIALSKLRRIQFDQEVAFQWWIEALIAVNKFLPDEQTHDAHYFLPIRHAFCRRGLKDLNSRSSAQANLERSMREIRSEAMHCRLVVLAYFLTTNRYFPQEQMRILPDGVCTEHRLPIIS